jgi:membrane protease YdiL (CAAX protease family)
VERLLQRLVLWRVNLPWYAVAVLLIPLTQVLVAVALGHPEALGSLAPKPLPRYPAAYGAHFLFGPLFEEYGWHGFALHRLQHRYGPCGERSCSASSGAHGISFCMCRCDSKRETSGRA